MLRDIFAVVGLVAIVTLFIWSVIWLFKKIIPSYRARVEQERRTLHETLVEARTVPLEEAETMLRKLGLSYNYDSYCKGRFTFPRHFWEWGDAEVKAFALLTLVNFYQAHCSFSTEQLGYYSCQEHLTGEIIRRARKKPHIAVAIACAMARSVNKAKKDFQFLLW